MFNSFSDGSEHKYDKTIFVMNKISEFITDSTKTILKAGFMTNNKIGTAVYSGNRIKNSQ
jgi:hypothetical protein